MHGVFNQVIGEIHTFPILKEVGRGRKLLHDVAAEKAGDMHLRTILVPERFKAHILMRAIELN